MEMALIVRKTDSAMNAREWREFIEECDAFSVVCRPGANLKQRVAIILARSTKKEPCLCTIPEAYWVEVIELWHDLDAYSGD